MNNPLVVTFMILLSVVLGADLSGQWTIRMKPDFKGLASVEKCRIRQRDKRLTVQCGSDGAEMVGAVDGRKAEWHRYLSTNSFVTFTAEIARSEKAMNGVWHLQLDSGSELSGKFTATKT